MCRARSYSGDVHDQTDRRTTQATGTAVQECVRKGPCAQNDPVTSPSCAIWRGMYNANCKNHHVTRRIAIESRSTMPCRITHETSVKRAGFRPARPRNLLKRRRYSNPGPRSRTRWTVCRFVPAAIVSTPWARNILSEGWNGEANLDRIDHGVGVEAADIRTSTEIRCENPSKPAISSVRIKRRLFSIPCLVDPATPAVQ